MPTLHFDNHDGCGDYVFSLGHVEFQTVNTATNAFFFLAGLSLCCSTRTAQARQSGLLLAAVGFFSSVYHATSSWGGFLLDIISMAIWAVHLIGVCQVACGALGYHNFQSPCDKRSSEEWGLAAALAAVAGAVLGPFVAFEVFDADPITVWNIWATCFLILILVGVLPALAALRATGFLPRFLPLVATAIAAIGLGVVCTRLILMVCVPGYFTMFPLHSLWHGYSATGAYFTVRILDETLSLAPGRRAGGHSA